MMQNKHLEWVDTTPMSVSLYLKVMYNAYSWDFRRDLKLYLCPACPVWNSIPIPLLCSMINDYHGSSSGPGSNL